jgi:hypothetical protein
MNLAVHGTVAGWLTLLGWEVELAEEAGRFFGTATRRTDTATIRVAAQSGSSESLAWRLVELATLELESRSSAPPAARAA